MAALDAHTPTIMVGGGRITHVHQVDVVILGSNSLFAAIAAIEAVKRGCSVLMAGEFGMDGLPLGLIEDPAFRLAVTGVLGGNDGIEAALSAAFTQDLKWCRGRFDYSLWASSDLAILTPSRSRTITAPADRLSASLRRCAEDNCDPVILPMRGKRRHGILARQVVVTSMVTGLSTRHDEVDARGSSYRWNNGAVVCFGTARREDMFVGDAVSAALEDVVSIHSGHWLRG